MGRAQPAPARPAGAYVGRLVVVPYGAVGRSSENLFVRVHVYADRQIRSQRRTGRRRRRAERSPARPAGRRVEVVMPDAPVRRERETPSFPDALTPTTMLPVRVALDGAPSDDQPDQPVVVLKKSCQTLPSEPRANSSSFPELFVPTATSPVSVALDGAPSDPQPDQPVVVLK